MWDPDSYLRRADERGRPFSDLLAQVAASTPAQVVDLGCGPGNLTVTLLARWPRARVLGVDNSAEMLQAAQVHAIPGRLEFAAADVRDWQPEEPVDVLISNATLQWVPGHLELFPRLVGSLAPGGWFAFQVPGNFDAPSHTLLAALRRSPAWRDRLGEAVILDRAAVAEPAGYLSALADLGCRAEVWETTYLHPLDGEDAVLSWMRGTGLRPVLAALAGDAAATQAFLTDYGALLRDAYPPRRLGATTATLLPFRRIFAVAQRAA